MSKFKFTRLSGKIHKKLKSMAVDRDIPLQKLIDAILMEFIEKKENNLKDKECKNNVSGN